MKKKVITSILLNFLVLIIMVIQGIRVARIYTLEGPLLLLFLIVNFLVIYFIIKNGTRIYREYREKK